MGQGAIHLVEFSRIRFRQIPVQSAASLGEDRFFGIEGTQFSLRSSDGSEVMKVRLLQVKNRLYRLTVGGAQGIDIERLATIGPRVNPDSESD